MLSRSTVIGGLIWTYILAVGLEQSMRMILNLRLTSYADPSVYFTSNKYIPGVHPLSILSSNLFVSLNRGLIEKGEREV